MEKRLRKIRFTNQTEPESNAPKTIAKKPLRTPVVMQSSTENIRACKKPVHNPILINRLREVAGTKHQLAKQTKLTAKSGRNVAIAGSLSKTVTWSLSLPDCHGLSST